MNSIELAKQIRRDVVTMCHRAKAAHVASCLSCADILAVWFAEKRDIPLIVSKGHAAAALYSALARTGHFDPAELEGFGVPGRLLECTHVSASVPGVVHSTGSLGHGLPVACGMALGGQPVAVLMSDAELQCGTTWEAAQFAQAYNLPVTVLVDLNRWQALGETNGVLGIPRFPAVEWTWATGDGHDHHWIRQWLGVRADGAGPCAVFCETLKGRGVSFMEDDPLTWHYRAPNDDELRRALKEIDHA